MQKMKDDIDMTLLNVQCPNMEKITKEEAMTHLRQLISRQEKRLPKIPESNPARKVFVTRRVEALKWVIAELEANK